MCQKIIRFGSGVSKIKPKVCAGLAFWTTVVLALADLTRIQLDIVTTQHKHNYYLCHLW